jgi:glycosyltransferase A (GT-A) superfamily protein (DUF2064 family)
VLARSLEAALDAGRDAGCRLEIAATRPETAANRPETAALGAYVAEQRGRSFGDRFRNALSDALERTDGPVVAVGSDVPGLSARHVRAALSRLGEARDRVVVGPSPDGGFYLLATHRELDGELARVRWRSRRALGSLIAALEESGLEVCMLEPLRDLDRSQDLQAWMAREGGLAPRWRELVDLVRSLLAELCRPFVPSLVGTPAAGLRPALCSRGPPL